MADNLQTKTEKLIKYANEKFGTNEADLRSIIDSAEVGLGGEYNLESVFLEDGTQKMVATFVGTDGVTFEKAFLSNEEYTGTVVIDMPVKEYMFSNRANFKGNLKFTENVTYLNSYAFKQSGFTGNLELPNVPSIPTSCFDEVRGLTGDLIIPDSVTSIGAYAFRYFQGTGKLKLSANCTQLNNYSFYQTELTGELEIPSGITTIPQSCFYNNSGITSLILNNGLTRISSDAFRANTGLSGDLVVPDTVTAIDSWGFSGCGFKGTLTLGKSLQTLGNAAFRGCMFTGKLILPSTITNIEGYVFYTDTAFDKTIRCEAIVPPTLNNTANSLPFPPNTEGVVIEVPMASVEAYKSATNWSSYNIVGYEE